MNPVTCLVFASTNAGKFREVAHVCKVFGIRSVAPQDLCMPDLANELGVSVSEPVPDVAEHADSYHGNARLKADSFFRWCGLPSLADDTGLEVDALGGRPGVHSARYAGPHGRSEDNIRKLLREISQSPSLGKKGRRARFVCHLVLKFGDGQYVENHAELMGEIGFAPHGHGGFGYDSVFIVDGYGKTLAELKEKDLPVKTHRILALEKLLSGLRSPRP